MTPSRSAYDARREIAREVLVVGRDEQRPALIEQTAQQLAELGASLRVERRGRFVHQQDRRIDGQRARDRDPLSLAARQLARQRRGPMFDAKR